MGEVQESPLFAFYQLTLKNHTNPIIQCSIEYDILDSTLYSRSEVMLKYNIDYINWYMCRYYYDRDHHSYPL